MNADCFDNSTRLVLDDLKKQVFAGDRIAVAASLFSIYAYNAMKKYLKELDEFRFLFTSNVFIPDGTKGKRDRNETQKREYEQGLFGAEFETSLKNELSQKAIAAECAEWIKKKNVQFRSFKYSGKMTNTFMAVESRDDIVAYTPMDKFSAGALGVGKGVAPYSVVMRPDTPTSSELLRLFDRAWESDDLEDVTDTVIERIKAMCRENSPEYVYFLALHRIFSEFLDDISDDLLPNESVGFRQSAIWGKLYDFQQDAVRSVINKLETYHGCVLADSVGLGKTFTALAVIKYYELRNKDVLVLCPKKLGSNWTTYNNKSYVNNPIASDGMNYTVLYHTDLSRTKGKSETGVDLARVNWGNFDLVVIDESHNFRNGADSSRKGDDKKENRYELLMRKVVNEGKKTKVLMLSATPVNNRFRDLRNQLALAYCHNQDIWQENLRIDNSIEDVFRNAQQTFSRWSKLPVEARTTNELTEMLDFEFFEVLDQVTVARSRKHIQRYYDMRALGPFPSRNKPITRNPKLSLNEGSVNYSDIYKALLSLNLALYNPSFYVFKSARAKYGEDKHGNLTMMGRESGIKKLMRTNLLKRLESSVWSFRLTLERILASMEGTLDVVNRFKNSRDNTLAVSETDAVCDLDPDDEETMAFEVGKSVKIDLADMDWMSWEREIESDVAVIKDLLAMIGEIDSNRDAKLQLLLDDISAKVRGNINPGNKKVIVFTAFADTAHYLYGHVSAFAKDEFGLESALITGGNDCRCTIKSVGSDMSRILSCFSPVSKERDAVYPELVDANIDILIATDCVSEGQNLQDCDYLVNYDIHWNPVRIVQRFGRVDRIGSRNDVIQLVNYWPDVQLDEYINLRERVENRMRAVNTTATGDEDYINEGESADLEFRRRQLTQMREEVVDLEDVSGGVSITDLGLNEFRMDLVSYYKENPEIEDAPNGIHAVVAGADPGAIFVLKRVGENEEPRGKNYLHPYYVVYVLEDGTILHGHLQPKAVLDTFRSLCKGKSEPDEALCKAFNKMTKNGRDMKKIRKLLENAVGGIVKTKNEFDFDSFISNGSTSFLTNSIEGLDDFEVICYLAIR